MIVEKEEQHGIIENNSTAKNSNIPAVLLAKTAYLS